MTVLVVDPVWEPSLLPPPEDLVVGVSGTLQVCDAAGVEVLGEEAVPLVELASALLLWRRSYAGPGLSLLVELMAAESFMLVWMRFVDGGWRFGGLNGEDEVHLSQGQAESLVDDYLEQVEAWLQSALSRSLDEVGTEAGFQIYEE